MPPRAGYNNVRITIKVYWILLCHLSSEFCENRLSSFCLDVYVAEEEEEEEEEEDFA